MHLDSRCFLGFVADGKVCQFKVLCFGLSTAPRVHQGPDTPASGDWLVLASSRKEALWARDVVLNLSPTWNRGQPGQVSP